MITSPRPKTTDGPAERSLSEGILHLVALVRPYKLRLVAALSALLIGSSVNLIFPEVVRRALAPQTFPVLVESLPIFFGLLAALFVLQGAAFYVRSYLFGLLGQQVFADVRGRLFAAVTARDIAFFDGNRSGDLASRLNSDAALVQDLVSLKVSVILRYGLQVVLGTALMAWMSWRMTFAIVASLLCMVIVSSGFARSLRGASRRFQSALAALTAFAAESFAGAKVIRALGAETSVTRSFTARSEEVLEAGRGRVRVSAAFSSGASLLLNVLLLGVVWYGVSLVVAGSLPISDLAAFALYGSIVAVSFAFLVGAYSEVVQSLGGLDRVFDLCTEGTERDDRRTENISALGPDIAFKEITFSYPQRADVVVLDQLSFEIKGGSTVGIMGPSGAGKSSIIQLLLKFYPYEKGSITVDSHGLEQISAYELSSKIAWVPQEPLLFGFSILENLTLGNPQLKAEYVEAKLREWGFLDFVWDLPGGLSMVLGEHGTQLSGGQRQRVSIARALLRAPRVLLLDEATSGLDSELEERVLLAVRSALPQATVVIVSHRLSSVKAADTIFVVNEGRIVESGAHHELTAASGLYSHYVRRQAAG